MSWQLWAVVALAAVFGALLLAVALCRVGARAEEEAERQRDEGFV